MSVSSGIVLLLVTVVSIGACSGKETAESTDATTDAACQPVRLFDVARNCLEQNTSSCAPIVGACVGGDSCWIEESTGKAYFLGNDCSGVGTGWHRCDDATHRAVDDAPDCPVEDAATCPTTEPTEGAPCTSRGLVCHGFGSFSCPETATCSDAGTWAISCPSHPFGTETGTCGCAHPGA
jgi:hypothetical protein